MRRFLLPLLIAALSLTACSDGTATTTPAQLTGITWRLTATGGVGGVNQPVPPDLRQPITVKFDARALNVSTGCNGMGGAYTTQGKTIIVKLVSTMMACSEPLGSLEAHLGEVLSQKPTFAMDGNQLTLTAPSGRALTFVKA